MKKPNKEKNSNHLYLRLGRRIAFLRKQQKMSQLELSLDTGLSKSYLSDLENGRRNPSLKILAVISLALGISLSTLFSGVDELEK